MFSFSSFPTDADDIEPAATARSTFAFAAAAAALTNNPSDGDATSSWSGLAAKVSFAAFFEV